MPPLSADDLPNYRRAIDRAVSAWGHLADHIRVRLTAALRRAHGTNLPDGFEGGPDIPRSFPEACHAFRQALYDVNAFEDHPSDFPWPQWGNRSLALDGSLPDIDQWIASLDGIGEDEWRWRVVDPFRQQLGVASLYFGDFMHRSGSIGPRRPSLATCAKPGSDPTPHRDIDQAGTNRGTRAKGSRPCGSPPATTAPTLHCRGSNGMTTLNESVDAWAERCVTARLVPASGGRSSRRDGKIGSRKNAEGELVIGGLIDLMLRGDEGGINAVVRELRDSPYEFRHLADWLRSLQHDWSFVFDRGWLWWKLVGDLPQPQPIHPAASQQQEEQVPKSLGEGEGVGTMSNSFMTAGILAPNGPDRPACAGRSRGGQRQERREMAWDETLNELRQVLAELYPGPPETRALLETAGVPTGKILLEAAAQTRWHNALREAHLQGNVEAILSAAHAEYGSHVRLQVAAAAYRAKHRPEQLLAESGAVAGAEYPTLLGPRAAAPSAMCDLAIVTAMPDELDPLFRLTGGKDSWGPFQIDRFIHYHKKLDFDGQALDVVAVSLWRYGDTPTAGAVHRLKQLRPRMLAMTGICAGWEGKDGIEFGDVIIAEGGFQPREGKQEGTKFHPDTHLYVSPAWVLQQAKDSLSDEGWVGTIKTQRPRSLRSQGEWLLCQVGAAGFQTGRPRLD